MSWRIHFTTEDLMHTRVAATMGPLAETQFAVALLRCHWQHPTVLGGWKRGVRNRLTPAMKPFVDLVPPGSWGVDIATLTGEAPTIEQGLAGILEMRPEHVRLELESLAQWERLPTSVWNVAERGNTGRQELAGAAKEAFEALIAPYWTRVQAHLHAERASRSRTLVEGGMDALLRTLHPLRLRWKMPVLEMAVPGDGDLHLDGRGLVLVPSVFIGDLPVLLTNPNDSAASPRLMFPVARDAIGSAHLWNAPYQSNGRLKDAPLAALLGRTRAAALRRITDGCTTSELARLLEVTPAAASQHAAVLRDAGLITTHRRGSAVLHVLTPLGTDLLERS